MVLKEFKVAVPGKGKIDISFYLHFDNHSVSVGEIKLHADYETDLPHRLWLKQDNGQWKLFDEHPQMQNGAVKVIPEFLHDEVSNLIAAKIQEIKEEEMN